MPMDTLLQTIPPIIWLAIIWTLPWKGYALWRAGRNNHVWWFVVLFLFNTLAVLEIIYIFFVQKKPKQRPEAKPETKQEAKRTKKK